MSAKRKVRGLLPLGCASSRMRMNIDQQESVVNRILTHRILTHGKLAHEGFGRSTGAISSIDNLSRRVKSRTDKEGWDWLRHANATPLDAVGTPLGTVQALLGHSSNVQSAIRPIVRRCPEYTVCPSTLQLVEVLPIITSYRALCFPMEPTRTQVMLPSSPVAGICAGQTPPVSVPQPVGSALPLISGEVPDAV